MQDTEATKKIKELSNKLSELKCRIRKIEEIIKNEQNEKVDPALKLFRTNSLSHAKLQFSFKKIEFNHLVDSYTPEELKDVLNSIFSKP
jgi:conjugal transfer/entry exclusion protein